MKIYFMCMLLLLSIGASSQQPAAKEAIVPKTTESTISKPPFATVEEAVRLAERKFKQYLPRILKSHDAILDVQESYTGDFTGEGVADVAIFFSLAPAQGGNMVAGQGITMYQNLGNDVKVIAGFDPDYLFSFSRISDGKIYVEKLEYKEDDPRCCPSIKTEHALTISGSTAF